MALRGSKRYTIRGSLRLSKGLQATFNQGLSMKVQFTGRHFEASENLQGNIEESLNALVKFNDQIQDAKVVLDMAPNGLRQASVQVSVANHGVVAASAEAETMRKAVDIMLDKLERLLKKDNEKSKEHRAPAVDQVVIP